VTGYELNTYDSGYVSDDILMVENIVKKSILNADTNKQTKNKLRGFSPQANYTDRETAACRRS
jgi:hypothetical protein